MTDMPPYLAVKDEDKNNGQGDCDESSDSDDSDLPLCFDKPRHNEPIKGSERVEHTWRVKEKYKTHCVALVLCLNIGVDPPDVVKTQPCARLECWIDPHSLSPTKALESIGQALQAQYERWQPRARYKQSLDPTSDEIKKLCCSLRRNAKDERVLFHYNGHGVPKPTAQGEIWVFNRAYTQYIPLSMYDLQTWMGAPSLYVYDCSNAGVILDNFKQFAEQHERDYEMQLKSLDGAPAPAAVSYRNCIQLAACAAGQSLPQHPALPADLFTACLTTPVHMHMKWFVLRNKHRLPKHLHELIDKIPGQVTDRRTMLGELNWIFTAITDTIAWSSLPPELFQQLFRADLLTASLCRNYLLADRVMRSYNCTPVCMPALPSLARHPLWAAWEHTLELALKQLPALLQPAPATSPPTPAPLYQHSTFFRDQLTAFHVWLELGKHDGVGATRRPPPEQLPMVLQVLLSTLHRLRALHILCRFLALGAWAVRAVLAVGIFPYMLKLLQASAPDLRATMLYIWANIISVDPSCQVDLVNAKGHKYFLSVLQDPTVDADHRTLAAYVLAGIVDNYKPGQEACLQGGMISLCLEQTLEQAGSPRLQQWASVALGRLWRGSSAARAAADRDLAHEKLALLLRHPAPETRAACAWALGTLIGAGGGGGRGEHTRAVDQQLGTVLCARLHADVALCARADLLAALQWLVLIFEQHFIAVYIQERMRRSDTSGVCGEEVDAGQDALAPARPRIAATPPLALPAIGSRSVYMKVWSTLCAMSREPHPYIAQLASDIIAYIHTQVDSVGRECEMSRSGSSSSLPPSPNTRSHVSDRVRRAKTGLPHTISEDSVSIRDRLDSTSSNSSIPKKPLVSTQFVQWSWEQFARDTSPPPCCPPGSPSPGTPASPGDDSESRDYHERAWRRARNKNIRREARGLRNARVSRLECQVFHARCPLPPAALHFHPYDQHVAVAYKDNLHIWDWGTGAKLRSGLVWTRTWGRVTSLLYLDTHARPLLAAASHRGDLAIYRPSQSGGGGGAGGGAGAGGGGGEGGLVSAWRALDVRPAHDYRPPPAQPIYSLAQLVTDQFASGEDKLANKNAKQDNRVPGATRGGGGSGGGGGGGGAYSSGPPPTLLAWSGARHSLAVAGRASTLKLWDLHAELLAADIHTGTDASVSALWRGGAACPLLACGFSDGSVRVWDERSPAPAASPAPAPAASPAPAPAPLLSAAMRPDLYILLVASMSGEVCIYDTRKMSPLVQLRAPGPLAAVDLHPRANVFACGSVNQSISMYELSGAPLNTIKFHEGFMGARIGPVSCLAFHPLRCALGVGARDSTVSVYSEARR